MKVGLIKGRHDMPVKEYIFDSVGNVLNFKRMDDQITVWLYNHRHDIGDRLYVYTTGLTAVVAAVVKACYEMDIPLSLMQYDMVTGEYVEQAIRDKGGKHNETVGNHIDRDGIGR